MYFSIKNTLNWWWWWYPVSPVAKGAYKIDYKKKEKQKRQLKFSMENNLIYSGRVLHSDLAQMASPITPNTLKGILLAQ